MNGVTIAAAFLFTGVLACGQPNPIIGVWVIDEETSSTSAQAAASIAGIERVEFRDDKRVIGTKSVDVGYEIDDTRVIVTERSKGEGEVYTVLEDGRLQKDLPMGMVVVYRREGAASAATQEPNP